LKGAFSPQRHKEHKGFLCVPCAFAVNTNLIIKTIRERFDTYRFVEYKEYVIDLLQRVCMVSVETMKIYQTMLS